MYSQDRATQQAESWKASVSAESKKDYDMALMELNGYETAGGDSYLVQLRTGWLQYLKGDFKKAISAYRNAARQQSQAIAPLQGIINCARSLKDEKELQQAANEILRMDSAHYASLCALGESQYRAGNFRDALQTYRRAASHYPEDTTVISGLAWSYLQSGDKTAAERQFRVLLILNSAFPYAQQGLELAQGKSIQK